MDLFDGNRKLEEVIFTGMDYALWSRHDIEGAFTPFMMLFKDEQRRLHRVVSAGDPNEMFEKMLQEDTETYDQIVMCFEGRVSHNGEKHDAIIVKGFDTSHPKGLLFVQRFRGKESGEGFEKLGNPALYSREEKLPTKLVARTSNKTIPEPYITGVTITKDNGLLRHTWYVGHSNASILSNIIFDTTLNIVERKETNFSGEIEFKFVPGMLKIGEFEKFIFSQLRKQVKKRPEVIQWENSFSKSLILDFVFEEEPEENKPEAASEKSSQPETPVNEYAGMSTEVLRGELRTTLSIPWAKNSPEGARRIAAMQAELERRSASSSTQVTEPDNNKEKKWWQFWK